MARLSKQPAAPLRKRKAVGAPASPRTAQCRPGGALACVLAGCLTAAAGLAQAQPAAAQARATSATGAAGAADDTAAAVARGRAVLLDRAQGFCLLCHSGPFPEERFQGNLAPSLAGVGSRLTAAQLRARVADARAFNPHTIMPSYARTEGFTQVAAAQAGRPLLSAQQLDDVAAFLATLKE